MPTRYPPLAAAIQLLLATGAAAAVIAVPADHPTIQAAINAALDGDEVVVSPGTYDASIDFLGKAITVRSTAPEDSAVVVATMLVLVGEGSVVRCVSGETAKSVLAGFVISSGNATVEVGQNGFGGGMLVVGSSPTVQLCTFYGNAANQGGAISLTGSTSAISRCTFSGNLTFGDGGAIHAANSAVAVTDCAFTGNFSTGAGSAVFASSSTVTMTRCVATANRFGGPVGSTVFVGPGSAVALKDSRVCGNDGEAVGGDPFADAGGNVVGYFCPPPPPPPPECVADLNGDGKVNGADLGILLASWGLCD